MVDNSLVVEAKHEERSDDKGFISRQFTRRFLVPEDVEIEKMESSLDSEGSLSIRAPVKKPDAVQEPVRVIPIKIESTSKPIDKATDEAIDKDTDAKKDETKE